MTDIESDVAGEGYGLDELATDLDGVPETDGAASQDPTTYGEVQEYTVDAITVGGLDGAAEEQPSAELVNVERVPFGSSVYFLFDQDLDIASVGRILFPNGVPDGLEIVIEMEEVGLYSVEGFSDEMITAMPFHIGSMVATALPVGTRNDFLPGLGDGTSGPETGDGDGEQAPAPGGPGGAGVPGPGEFWLVDQSGQPVQQVEPREFSLDGDTEELDFLRRQGVRLALHALGPAIALVDLANERGWTVCVGVDADLAAIAGLTGGAGLYFGPDDEIGVYGSLGTDFGLVLGASVGLALMVFYGPPSRMGGWGRAVEVSGGELVTAGGAILFDSDGKLFGVAAEIGVGVGLPINVFESRSYTWLKEF